MVRTAPPSSHPPRPRRWIATATFTDLKSAVLSHPVLNYLDAFERFWPAFVEAVGRICAHVEPKAWRDDQIMRRSPDLAERLEAARRIAQRYLHQPVDKRRWNAHRVGLDQAIAAERAQRGASWRTVLNNVTAQALLLALRKGERTDNQLLIRRNGRRRRVPPGVVAPIELAPSDYRRWLRTQLAKEIMDILLPGWREVERERRQKRAALRDAEKAGENKRVQARVERRARELLEARGHVAAEETLAALKPDHRALLAMVLVGENGKTVSAAEASRRLGKSSSWGRQTLRRINERLSA